jgi:hypothetical protein
MRSCMPLPLPLFLLVLMLPHSRSSSASNGGLSALSDHRPSCLCTRTAGGCKTTDPTRSRSEHELCQPSIHTKGPAGAAPVQPQLHVRLRALWEPTAPRQIIRPVGGMRNLRREQRSQKPTAALRGLRLLHDGRRGRRRREQQRSEDCIQDRTPLRGSRRTRRCGSGSHGQEEQLVVLCRRLLLVVLRFVR